MKKLVAVMVLLSLLAIGCSQESYGYTPNTNAPIVTTKIIKTTVPNGEEEKKPPQNVTWISPGKVLIGNFHAGARAEYPITIHNGNSIENEQKKVTTDAGETSVDIPLNVRLHAGELSSLINLVSDNSKDSLNAVSYDPVSRKLTVKGFNPDDSRIITLIFTPDTAFTISFRYPDWADASYGEKIKNVGDWVIIADPTPVLAPFETRDIIVALDMPQGAENPMSQYEFWIVVMQEQTGVVQTQLASRWVVTARM